MTKEPYFTWTETRPGVLEKVETALELNIKQGIAFPLELPSFANDHSHWRNRHRITKAQRRDVLLRLSANFRDKPKLPCTVRLTRLAPLLLDDDNLRQSLKGPRDAITDWLDLPNDRHPAVCWMYGQTKTTGGVLQQIRIEFAPGIEHCEHCGAPTIGGRYEV